MSKVAVVIPVLNQFQLALEAIESIRTEHEVVVFPILNYRENLSLSGAWNLGIEKALWVDSDYILIINDDILLSRWAIDALVNEFEDRNDDRLILLSGVNIRSEISPEEIYTLSKPEKKSMQEHPDFSCFMVTQWIVDLIGKFDENFTPAYFEDNDFHRRINLAGFKAMHTTLAPFYHYGSRTQNSDPNIPVVPSIAFEINRLYYLNKWGGEPGAENFSTPFNDPEKTFKDW